VWILPISVAAGVVFLVFLPFFDVVGVLAILLPFALEATAEINEYQ
jgi:hypothetical protein